MENTWIFQIKPRYLKLKCFVIVNIFLIDLFDIGFYCDQISLLIFMVSLWYLFFIITIIIIIIIIIIISNSNSGSNCASNFKVDLKLRARLLPELYETTSNY